MPVHIRLFLTLPLAWITLLVLLSSGPAYAEWVSIGKSESGMTAFVDPDTIRRKGNFVKIWELYDFKIMQTREGDLYISGKAQIEYDCVEERRRTLAYLRFSGNMGGGELVSSASSVTSRWEPVAPESIGQAMWKVACRNE